MDRSELRRVAGRALPRARRRGSRRAPRRLQHGLLESGARENWRLRCAIQDGRRRRRHLLAHAQRRLQAGLLARRFRLALPPQHGEGNAEAMLYPKYPERFNIMGQIAWRGIIPGLARTIPGGNRKRVLWNASARAQSLFDPGLTLAKVLPQTLEWTVLSAVALVASVVLGVSLIPAAAMLALGPIWSLYYAFHAPLEKSHDRFI